MNILAIDTCTKKANVSLKIDNLIINKCVDNEITHSEKLLPLINDSLKETNITLKDIDYLACSTGPGSFTGIRIGIATIKAFAKILSTPIFAIPSLDIVAYTTIDNLPDYVISILDAKNNRIYYSVYEVEKHKTDDKIIPTLKRISDYNNDTIDVAIEKISKINFSANTSLNIIGDCADNYKELFINKLNTIFDDTNILDVDLSTESLIKMVDNYSKLNINKNYETNYLTLDATYVRPSQAERAKNNEL